ncbi:MAG: alpha/beta hydrolase [Pseudomonadota bacterium]
MKTGIFSDGMAWASMGEGEKVAILIPGGPGNPHPGEGMLAKLNFKPMRGLMDDGYRLVCVARRRNVPEGHSIASMAADYANMIEREFGGRVALVVGSSYGGIIAQYLAADHPHCFQHIVVHVAACEIRPEGRDIDYAYAKAVSEGQRFGAGVAIAPGLFPDSKFPRVMKLFSGILGLLSAGQHQSYRRDILIEGQAEKDFSATDILSRIKVPVCIIAGDQDFYFPKELTLLTHEGIEGSTLIMYEGQGHVAAAMNKNLSQDILDYVRSTPPVYSATL